MSKKYVFSMWVYNDIREFTPDEMKIWVDCGMNFPLAPKTYVGRDDPEVLIPWLDKAQELGIKLIANYEELSYRDFRILGEDGYRERLRPLVEKLGNHPALHGFYIGDEPGTPEDLEACYGCIKVNKELAPDLTPFLNYAGSMAHFDKDDMGGRDLGAWLKRVKDETGSDEVCFDVYDQMINDGGGKTMFFDQVNKFVEASKIAGCDCWGCLLSSGGHVYKAVTEADIRWQVHMAAALGLRGVLWFRFYDRDFAIGSYGSPVDEFGNKTEAYYGMMRVQRRFQNHYGDLFMRLNHKKTYSVRLDRGIFPMFCEGEHGFIKNITADDETIASFFEDENGTEYLVLVNSEWRHYGAVRVSFDASRCRLKNVTMNGADEGGFEDGPAGGCQEIVLHPAGIAVIKIEKK